MEDRRLLQGNEDQLQGKARLPIEERKDPSPFPCLLRLPFDLRPIEAGAERRGDK